jgi:predicted RNA-binding Zn ribbon-like protein
MENPYLPWLIFPPAVDLANTVSASPSGERDLLETDEQLAAWIASEHGRIPDAKAASGHLDQVRALRRLVREVLYAQARGEQPPDRARRELNSISAAAPLRVGLAPGGEIREESNSPDPYTRFEASVARSAIMLVGGGEEELSVCKAPSCGMLFLREHPRQIWCTKECGNRARVARQAARRRGGRRQRSQRRN